MDRKNVLRWIAGTGLAASLVVGGLASQGVFAQTSTPTTGTAVPRATAVPADDSETTAPPVGDRGAFGRGAFGRGGPRGGHRGGHGLIEATASVSGLTEAEVRAELEAGKSPAQIAQEHGKTAADVVSAAVALEKTRLDQAVADGRLTQAEADEKLARVTSELEARVQETGLPAGPEGGRGGRGGHMNLVGVTAEVTGLTEAEVRAELEAGKSLAQVAQDNGKSADDVIAALRVKGEERLAQELERARQQLEVAGN